MDKFIINGPTKLNGEVKISGSKNAALPILTACLSFPGTYKLKNIPDLKDTRTMMNLLRIIGAKITKQKNIFIIDTTSCDNPEAPYELVKTMRASFYVLGPLLSRFKYAKVSLPGGCAWGPRPIDFHLKAFKKLGAKIKLNSGYIIAKGKLSGNKIIFSKPSVGATGNVIMSCSNLNEEVVIENAAKEPEIVDLCKFLILCGVKISGVGTSSLVIRGTNSNKIRNVSYSIIPDRIEAGTFLIACAATGGCLKINNIIPEHLNSIIENLIHAKIKLSINKDSITINSSGIIRPVDVLTDVYPGFPTDLQAQWISLMVTAKGKSFVKDTIYIDRFTHVPELIRLGSNIKMDNNIAIINGVDKLYGAKVMSTDIRASASLIIAAMISNGKTELSRIYHIDRGYENIEKKLNHIGAKIKRINSPII